MQVASKQMFYSQKLQVRVRMLAGVMWVVVTVTLMGGRMGQRIVQVAVSLPFDHLELPTAKGRLQQGTLGTRRYS